MARRRVARRCRCRRDEHQYQYYADSASPSRQLRVDGDNIGSSASAFTDGNITRIGWGNSGSGNQAFKGLNAEIIIYSNNLNTAQRLITENYLSAKYAIAMALPSSDKYTGDDPAKGHYDFDVIGIGRAADGAHTSSGDAGLLISENFSSLDSGDYLLAGHKTTQNGFTAADVPGTPDGLAERWSRVWYLDKTGNLDASLTFDFSDGGLAVPNAIGYVLLYSPSNAFGFTSIATGSLVGDQVSFAIPDGSLTDGYYTLGIIPEAGTGILLALGGLTLLRRRR